MRQTWWSIKDAAGEEIAVVKDKRMAEAFEKDYPGYSIEPVEVEVKVKEEKTRSSLKT